MIKSKTDPVRRIAKNTVFLALGQITSMFLMFVLVVSIARYLGDDGLGKYSFAFAFTNLFFILSNFGLSTLTFREVSRDTKKASKFMGNIIVIKLILSAVTIILIFILINLMNYSIDTTIAVYIMSFYVVSFSLVLVFIPIFAAFERMEYSALVLTINALITAIFGIGVLSMGYGLIELVLVYPASTFFTAIFAFFICSKKFAKPKLEIDLKFWRYAIKEAYPFSIMPLFLRLYFQIGIICLFIKLGEAEAGLYSAAYNFVIPLLFIQAMFNVAIFPIMSRFSIEEKKSLIVTVESALRYICMIGVPISVGLILLSDEIILMFYGSGFTSSIIVLQIIAWFIPLRFINGIFNNTLSVLNRQKQMGISIVICAVLCFILNVVLINRMEIAGAAIATILTEFLLLIFFLYLVGRYLYTFKIHKILAKPIVSSLVMGLVLYYSKEINLFTIEIINLLIVIFFSAITYSIVLYSLKGFSDEDMNLLRKILHKR